MGERCRCGAELLPHLSFCVGCGVDRQPARPGAYAAHGYPAPTRLGPAWQPAPAPQWHPAPWEAQPIPAAYRPSTRRSSPAPWLITLAVLVVLLLSASAALVTLRPSLVGLGSDPVVAPAAARPAVTSPAPGLPQSAPTVPAREELAAQVDRDRSRVESVAGSWVPQLSSKKAGTVDRGVTYDDEKILAHYRGLASRYPGTALLWSGDWPVFRGDDFWVVISAQSFPSAAAANAWCDAQGFGRDDCLAKNVSHTGGPAGTTVAR